MTDKEKIIDVLISNYDDIVTHNYRRDIEEVHWDKLADALLSNGYGDVSEWKKRAEMAESELEKHKRALRIAAPRLKCYGGWGKGF